MLNEKYVCMQQGEIDGKGGSADNALQTFFDVPGSGVDGDTRRHSAPATVHGCAYTKRRFSFVFSMCPRRMHGN